MQLQWLLEPKQQPNVVSYVCKPSTDVPRLQYVLDIKRKLTASVVTLWRRNHKTGQRTAVKEVRFGEASHLHVTFDDVRPLATKWLLGDFATETTQHTNTETGAVTFIDNRVPKRSYEAKCRRLTGRKTMEPSDYDPVPKPPQKRRVTELRRVAAAAQCGRGGAVV